MPINRREFLKLSGSVLASGGFAGLFNSSQAKEIEKNLFFDLSLAEWSLHRALFSGKLDHTDFPAKAKDMFGFSAVEYVNQFFPDKAKNKSYLNELNSRCNNLGVNQVLIMIDNEGPLAASNEKARKQAVENHYKWVDAANHLNCMAIRVNVHGDGSAESQKEAMIKSLRQLAKFASDFGINILVENHGGLSSNGQWMADLMQQVGMKNCATLPDFGNFCIKSGENGKCLEAYNRYKGVKQMMPYAKDVSAKSYAFSEQGRETTIDYEQMLRIVKESGYRGHIGVEYEGDQRSEAEGIQATKALLLKVGAALSGQQAYLDSL